MSSPTPGAAWTRQRLLAVLVCGVMFAVVGMVGLVIAVARSFSSSPEHPSASTRADFTVGPGGVRGAAYRNAQAAVPMLASSKDDLAPAPPSLKEPGKLIVPAPTHRARDQIETGFPRTPAGAVGQLASIELAALSTLSISQAREVFDAWSLPTARFVSWEIARAIRDFHEGAGTVDGGGDASLSAVPIGAQIKATDGPDWVIACVQLDVRVSVIKDVRFGYGHCERMQWTSGRWLIAPGKPPAPAPSTWPRSDRSVEAGWKEYVETGSGHA